MAIKPAEQIAHVRLLSDRLLSLLIESSADAGADVAILALVDAAVRLLRMASPRMDTGDACDELARILRKIRRAEKGG
jgi:hypothetical protein